MIGNDYGERIRRAREALNAKQRAFGVEIGLNETNVHDLESGRKKLTPELTVLLEKVHGINLRWLLTGEGEMFIDKETEQKQINTATADNHSLAVVGNRNNVQMSERSGNESDADIYDSGIIKRWEEMLFEIFKLPLREASNILTDSLQYYRYKNALKINDKMKKLLSKRNVNHTRQVALSFGIPFIETSSLAEEEELQERWATLLANARDPNFAENKIRVAYIYVVNNLSVLDCRALKLLQKLTASNNFYYFPLTKDARSFEQYKDDLGPDAEKIAISVENLVRLRLIDTTQVVKTPKAQWGKLELLPNHNYSGEKDISDLRVETEDTLAPGYAHFTSFGLEFLEACGDG